MTAVTLSIPGRTEDRGIQKQDNEILTLPMKLLAKTLESGSLDTFCAALAQVKMCGGLFPVVIKIIIKAIAITEVSAFSW